jgi:hypothetical protein
MKLFAIRRAKALAASRLAIPGSRGCRIHIALVVFLGLVAALGIDVKLVQSQTKEADALVEQYARLSDLARVPEGRHERRQAHRF